MWKERQTSNLLCPALARMDSCISFTLGEFLKFFFSFCRYHKSQAIYLESKENTKISCVISSVGANEVVAAFICQHRGGGHGFIRAKDRYQIPVWCVKKLEPR